MQAYFTLTRRELGSYFVSVTGYIILAGALLMMGGSFVNLLHQLQGQATPRPATQLYYSTWYFWSIILLTSPIITMRLFALEKYSGTFETLMTTPVSDLQVVLAKFSAAMVFYMLMWLPSVASVLVLREYITQPQALDAWLLGSTFLGLTLIGGLFISLGCFASSLTRSQMVAAIVSLALGFTLCLPSFLADYMAMSGGWKGAVIEHLAMSNHMNDFARGLVDTRHVVFYLSTTALFLFLTLRVVESRRWK
jgi:ABC-2 type transport system permease protein